MGHAWKYDFEYIKNNFKNKGFTVITDKESYINGDSLLDCKDDEGYYYRLSNENLNCTTSTGGMPMKFAIFNFHWIENTQLWLNKNEKNWTIVPNSICDVTGYKGLKFHCNVCNKEFEMCVSILMALNKNCPCCHLIENCISTKYPDLVKYFNLGKNYPDTPDMVFASAKKKYWWKCNECGYEWFDEVNHRTKNGKVRQCKSCIGETANDKNRMFIVHPELKEEWDYDKNEIDPNTITHSSGKSYWWICRKCGNNFKQTVSHRVRINTGCPKCNKHAVSNFNRLSIFYPDISSEWNYLKNEDITPDLVSITSGKKYWWICPDCNSDYQMGVSSRVRGRGCNICSNSFGESKIRKYFEKNNIKFYHHKSFSDCKYINLLTFDFGIYIEGILNLIEYNGQQHYKSIPFFGGQKTFEYQQVRDNIKKEYCKNNDIPLIEIPYWEFNNIENILNNYLNI